MFFLSRQTVRRNWVPYVGSFIALSLGVALIGVTVELIAAVGGYRGGTDQTRTKLDDLVSMLGVMSGVSGFMAIFVVASTFTFVVSSRRRELGLLRLIGSTPRQVRRLILGEALTISAAASLAGCLFALLITPVVLRIAAVRGVTPVTLSSPSPWPMFAIAAPIGIVVALFGAWVASRRASKVPPVDALRESAVDRRRFGFWRLTWGVVCLSGSIAMLTLMSSLSGEATLVLSVFAPELLVITIICFGQLLFPPVVRLIARPFGPARHVTIGLARDNVSASSRRTASLAAPILAISAIAGSMILTLSFAADWSNALVEEQLVAPVVVQSNGDKGAGAVLAKSDAVRSVDGGISVGVSLHTAGEVEREVAEGIDPTAAAASRGTHAHQGSLRRLRGHSVAMARMYAGENGYHLGERVRVSFHGKKTIALRLVAIVDDAPDLQADILLPERLARTHAGGAVPDQWFVFPRTPTSAAALVATLNRELAGTRAHAERSTAWIAQKDADVRRANTLALWVLLGPAGVYAAIAIANTLLMGSLQRRHEFIATRLIGATPRQVRDMVLWESGLVAAAALLLGATTTALVGFLIRDAMAEGLDHMPLTVPWAPLMTIALVCAVIAAIAAIAPTGLVLRRVHPSEAVGD